MNKKHISYFSLSLSIAALLTLPGCWNVIKKYFGLGHTQTSSASGGVNSLADNADNSQVWLKIDGKPVLTEQKFDRFMTHVKQSNPYFQQMASIPDDLRQKMFERLIDQNLILAKARKLKLDQTEEHKKMMTEMMQQVEETLLIQSFEQDLLKKISISAQDIRNEYETNKKTYVKVGGGVLVQGLRFENAEDAEDFYNEVHKNPKSFETLAKSEKNADFKDFGRVSDVPQQGGLMDSDIPESLRILALTTKSVPGVIQARDGDSMWVLHISDKKETILFSFDEIEKQLEQIVRMKKFKDQLTQSLNSLRDEFTVDVVHQPVQTNTKTVTRLPLDQLPIKNVGQTASHDTQPTTENVKTA